MTLVNAFVIYQIQIFNLNKLQYSVSQSITINNIYDVTEA